jgi:hypothetical protein
MNWKPGPTRDTINVTTGEAVTRIIAFDPIAGAHVFEAPKAFEGNPGNPHPSGSSPFSGIPGSVEGHSNASGARGQRMGYENDPAQELPNQVLPRFVPRGNPGGKRKSPAPGPGMGELPE